MRKRPRKESFRVEPTKLNPKACPFEDYPEVSKTEQLEESLKYISRKLEGFLIDRCRAPRDGC